VQVGVAVQPGGGAVTGAPTGGLHKVPFVPLVHTPLVTRLPQFTRRINRSLFPSVRND
jgi:hypothetical protein